MNLQFEELSSASGACLGIATLNAEKTLNALTLPMIEGLLAQLKTWAHNPRITCVLLRGAGSKSFCAGGDVVSLVQACRGRPGEVPALAGRFFAAEYRLDYALHTYEKPLLCWGHGYVLGGGLGLLQGAGVRIVTPSSRLAMPEISIGLYPDVGAGWFLPRLPGKLGLFLAMTGAQVNGSDALELGLADRFMADDQQDALIDGLLHLNWQTQQRQQLNSLLCALEHDARPHRPPGQWLAQRPLIDQSLDVVDAAAAYNTILRWQGHPDPLLAKAADTLAKGCPLSARLCWEQQQRTRLLSLAEVLRLDYAMSLNCCRHPEFPEGVRARLIDKDHTPHWHWPDPCSIPEAVVQAHFSKVWEGRHPLADLGCYP
ncbi:enoyl-CoA hydratase/isomerase family protein [Pseudomonas typographi]|uniref:enoyl-CoA hydratase/isomerase family protein n=1 Tax=Pseudomonas typographi TaxID=2715964 RepID=UPI0016872324|nr:enoyl-CoA hydratase/isomerase family protein [Pseudomonas typographi]MBD1589064.1 enoyl-CoA hydratase/isomerase family protein [Pseudomonas typographi]